MHRTLSMDYAVIQKGNIVLAMDGGEKVALQEGNIVIQRGTNHAWRNEGAEVCRMVFVAAAREDIVLSTGEGV